MWSPLLFLVIVLIVVDSTRVLKQSQCVFRHGSRLPNVQPLFDIYESDEQYLVMGGDMTDNGEEQVTELGQYYKEKLIDADLITDDYEKEDDLIYLRTVIDKRVAQSMDIAIHEIFEDQAVGPILTPQRADDVTVSTYCPSYQFEVNYFRNYQSASYINQLFSSTEKQDLNTSVQFTRLFNFQYLLNLDEQITNIKEQNDALGDVLENNATWEKLLSYEEKIKEYFRLDSVIPYRQHGSDAQGYDFFKLLMDQIGIVAISNYGATSLCRGGPCKFTWWSSQNANIRMLAHQMGLLTLDNIWTEVPMGSSLCFDLYLENNQYSVDILFGEVVDDTQGNGNVKYSYEETIIEDDASITTSTTGQDSIIEYACADKPLASNCNVTLMIEYLNTRKSIASLNSCCTRDGNERVTTIFNDIKCNKTTSTNTEIANNMCATWRRTCPQTACNANEVYSPALTKCVAIATSTI